MRNWIRLALWPAVLAGLLVAGCSPVNAPLPTATLPSPATIAVVETPAAPTEAPSPTPLPGKVWLAAPGGAELAALEPLVRELSDQAGLSFEARQELQPADLTPETRVVVLSTAPANLNELQAAASQAQFVVISAVDIPAGGNLSVIRQRPEFQTFLAGFISVLLSTDWRAGGLLPGDGPLGAMLQEAYINGGRYFCGVCAPGWPLGVRYPQVVTLPAASGGMDWQVSAAGLFENQKVEVFYLAAEAVRSELVTDLQGKEQFGKRVVLVGDQPPPEGLQSQWAVTVTFDLSTPLRQVWPDLLSGAGGAAVDAPLLLTNLNPDNLGDSRLRLVRQLMEEIAAGRISPFTVLPE